MYLVGRPDEDDLARGPRAGRGVMLSPGRFTPKRNALGNAAHSGADSLQQRSVALRHIKSRKAKTRELKL